MKRIVIISALSILFLSGLSIFGQNKLEFELTDDRTEISEKISGDLILKVTKDRSVKADDFGWIIGVFKKRDKGFRRNLIYTNATGSTADKSQVYAWHLGNNDFPLERIIAVMGRKLWVKIEIIDPKVEGCGPDAAFADGKLRISWY
ncbi:MAG: hypothetical protein KIS76_11685 [Pyrinomonadaceae bacterium]|nr:hypothetical protein [Pyrinomonadaceae bacterium]